MIAFRASFMHRRLVCPGSAKLENGLPDTETDQAREGDLLHQFDSDPKISRASLKPEQRDVLRISSELDQFVFDHVVEQFSILSSDEFEDFRELSLSVSRNKSDTLLTGHCDRLRHYPKRDLIIVIDKKFGRREVEPAAANLQLRSYACGAYAWRPASNIVVAITQPRLEYSRRVTMSNYTVEDLNASREQLISIVDKCLDKSAPLNVTQIGCRYCRARAICPALREKLEADLSIVPFVAGTPAKREADAAEIIKATTDEQLDRLLVAIQMADFVKDIARDEARTRVSAGRLTTWKIGKEGEMRSITDPRRAFAFLRLGGELSDDQIFECAKLSITALKDKYRNKTGCSWKEAEDFIESRLGAVIDREPKRAPLSRVKPT